MLASACVTIPNARVFTIQTTLDKGATWSETQTANRGRWDFTRTLEELEPQLVRPDPENPSQSLPARAGAVCMSAEDYAKRKTALDQACRELGKLCSLEIRQMIVEMGVLP